MLKTRAVHTAGERPHNTSEKKSTFTLTFGAFLCLFFHCGDSFDFPDTLPLKLPSCEVN